MAVNIKKDFPSTRSRKPDLNTLVYGKVPPQACDMEEAVIGACLLERETFEQVMEIISEPEVFYMDAHKKVYASMIALYKSGSQIDLLTITEQLRKSNELDIVGGIYYLSNLTMAVISSAHAVTHARIVFEKFMQREIIRICGSAISDAYDDQTDVFDLIEKIEVEIKGVTAGIISDSAIPAHKAFGEMLTNIEHQKANNSDLIGISSGLPDLDRLTLGWIKECLIILAARPSVGKTAFAVNFATNAVTQNKPTLLFSLESSSVPLVTRIAAAKKEINIENIRMGRLTDMENNKLINYYQEFSKYPLHIDSKSRSLSTIIKVARKWHKKNCKAKGLEGLIIIDYLQLINNKNAGNREQEVAGISRGLKELSMELEVPIIALSQLNREVEKTGNKKPGLQHIRESGAIEQDADVIMFIWWEELANKERQLHLLIEKNREGKCGDVPLKMNAEFQKIMSIDDFSQNSVKPSFITNNSGNYNPDAFTEGKKNVPDNDDVPF
jgi:replicative DNA helicase